MLHIIIDNGDVFEGTPEQFEDFYAGGATDKESIERICEQERWSVKFLESPIGKTIESIFLGSSNQMTLHFTDGTSIGILGDTEGGDVACMRLVESK